MKIIKKAHVKIGDKVQVISGIHKHQIGTILLINKKKSLAILDTISPRLKTLKATEDKKEGIKKIPVTIAISNLMLWDSTLSIASRVGRRFVGEINKKIRYFKKTGNFVN